MKTDTLSIEEIYEGIARAIHLGIPGEWSDAAIEASFHGDDYDYADFVCSYTPADGKGGVGRFRAHPDLLDLFGELRSRMIKPGYKPWEKAIFTLTAAGQANLRFVYPDDAE